VHVEVTGMPRMLLAQAIEQFRISLEHQDDAMIAAAREELGRLVEHLRQ
jgi:hypothetical protein